MPDGYPISVLRGHIGAVTAIAFSPKYPFQLLSYVPFRAPSEYPFCACVQISHCLIVLDLCRSSDDGTCRIWDARSSQCPARVFVPRRTADVAGQCFSNHYFY